MATRRDKTFYKASKKILEKHLKKQAKRVKQLKAVRNTYLKDA